MVGEVSKRLTKRPRELEATNKEQDMNQLDTIQKEVLKKVKIIQWRVDSEIELRKAEKAKTRLENAGYTLISESIGMFIGKLVYKI
jgi:hypothetical protein